MVSDEENIARALFSPKMIYNGELQTEAFRLRESINEEYLSVVRMAISSWQEDIMHIPQRKNRLLYGYAVMNVAEVKKARFENVEFDVMECDNSVMKSHAGIYIYVGKERLKAGQRLAIMENDSAQDFLLLTIQRRLVEIARKQICKTV